MVRTVAFEINSANILEVIVSHNGFQGGDSGHGGFVSLTFNDIASTDMSVDGEQREAFEIKFRGDCERSTLVLALEAVIKELKENPSVINDIKLKQNIDDK